ncbi:MAG: hypothetical protein HOI59_14080 [Nitrospina sp.]|jgi:hypothetical protein|nr:hypothetical protein [Nitrospina sp.]MBT3414801.1 hypothetical protein [Nitrospina sp.]MBT3858171.1 hypothetical protein [Nitrospina sp.]MBT4103616.1 hypothetical protein [Nitrospina sp.]MBT4390548.1 hypothetical protein [Nitrospina sp.]
METPSEVVIKHEKLISLIWGIVVGLVLIHIALQACHYYFQELPWLLREIFDVDEEESFSTWFSAVLLLTCSTLLFLIALSKNKETYILHWYGLALGFCILSMDEVVGIHETFNTITEVAWTVPATWLIFLLLLVYWKFLIELPQPAKKQFLIAGAVYLSGGLLVEHLADYYVEVFEMDNFGYNLMTAFEESLEMAGVVLFIDSLLKYLATGNSETVTINIKLK